MNMKPGTKVGVGFDKAPPTEQANELINEQITIS
jgi:hypothetical protein